ncbi:MAG: transcription-repair coupling factor [Clostridia bacterium]|nr:transcription-repair coupling factor [Clostridia bacterium]
MNIFYDFLKENKNFSKLKNYIYNNNTPVLATGVIDTQKAHLIAGMSEEYDNSTLVITNSELKAKEIYNDLKFFMKDRVMLYPSKDVIFYWADVKSLDIIKQRFEIISKIINNEKITVVLSAEALFDRLVPLDIFKEFIFDINIGDRIDLNKICSNLVLMGYERCEMVEGQGQFALRGGILDIYSAVSSHAVRIELWGDEVDSIRILDTVSQRSVENAKTIKVYPMRELVYHNEDVEKAVENIKAELKSIKKAPDQLKITVDEAIERLSTQRSFSGVEKYVTCFYNETSTLIDYFDNPVLYVDEPNRVREHCEFITNEFVNSIEGRIDKGYMLPSQLKMIYTYDDIIGRIEKSPSVLMTSLMSALRDYKPKELVDFQVKATALVRNDMNLIAEDLGYMCQKEYRILFLAGGHTHCERMLTELQERGLKSTYLENIDNVQIEKGIVYITRGSLSHGFEYIRDKFAVVSEKDAFGEDKKNKRKNKNKRKDGIAIQNISDLKAGDYVVHENHGIGIFKGIEQIITDGVSKDFIKIGYAKEDVLYVAINQMDMVQKYIGGEATKPKLNRLGGASWEKAKARAKQAAFISAKELVELYAERQKIQGFKYSPDTLWQREFEEDFEYEETEDQLNSIAEIKEDMESGKVMDRLLCGDVGFGKTEVAIRAAFKTVQDGKQVAYLVPTTILARQHYMTFVERMENYPITIEMMSRFRTPKQQKETVENLKKGKTDIVIGTHRILSKDMSFKDLGLVIIDEEQRFGVRHKDKLKELRKNVNVLTLSATPIPRTLHMSMTGIRDMSVLAEPPDDRIPIQTYVLDYDPECIKDAIHRELARNGQVYFLHNRVTNIAETTNKLQELVPEAHFAYAHGQMSQRELEDIMMDFMDGEIDVLVCTTIIETGLDIPNVNTIIISNADKMGLSQLYQLRGRVGRSTRTSYAYLMYARDKVLNTDAEKRLQTIKEFTEFGSGFRVAMKDLEIRGAGNLLGAEQHGHMDSVGYELYCKLLNEAVMELKGETIITEFETLIDIKLNAFIPTAYISSEEQKLEMYKKISLISNLDDYYDVQEELEDRYGDIPRAVNNLIDVAYIKAIAHNIGATNVKQIKNKVLIYFKPDANVAGEKLMKLITESRGRILFTSTGGEPYLTFTLKDEKHILDEIKALIKSIS